MQDYRVTPELMTSCAEDVDRFCKGKGTNGKTIHCLMDHAQRRNAEEKLSSTCRVQVNNLFCLKFVMFSLMYYLNELYCKLLF